MSNLILKHMIWFKMTESLLKILCSNYKYLLQRKLAETYAAQL